ncbi:MAG TPA: chemotaxis protein CheX [Alphaproteobacteria bacterium]|nr:chemotaxis protein CheX [Alphaproteobacteria bacterium]
MSQTATKHQPARLALDQQLAHEITKAVRNAMQETFGVAVEAGPFEVGDGMVSLVGDVSGVIGIAQAQLEGTLTLCLTFETIRDLLPQIIGKSVSVTHEMAVDAVGEITNMIFGQIKADLGSRGYALKLGIPCVVTGKGHFVSQFHRGKYMIVPFHLDGQLFQVYVALHNVANDGNVN